MTKVSRRRSSAHAPSSTALLTRPSRTQVEELWFKDGNSLHPTVNDVFINARVAIKHLAARSYDVPRPWEQVLSTFLTVPKK